MVVQKTRRMRKKIINLGKEVNEPVEVGLTLKNKGNKNGVSSWFQTLSGIVTDTMEDKKPKA